METFLASQLFRYLIFPIGSAILGVAIKVVTRNDRFSSFKQDDFAVGLDLLKTACLLYLVLTTDRAYALIHANQALASALTATPLEPPRISLLQSQAAQLSDQISTAGWSTALFFIALWSVSTIVRKWGWRSEAEMSPVIGIAFPLAAGVLSLAVVMAGAVQ